MPTASVLPSSITGLVAGVMERCASVRQLTVPFIKAWCDLFATSSTNQRLLLIGCIRPWIRNLGWVRSEDDVDGLTSCIKAMIELLSLGQAVSGIRLLFRGGSS
jgi:hypothetical protein